MQHKAYPLQKAPAPPKCLSSSCSGKRGLWRHLVSLQAQGNLTRHQLMKGSCSLCHLPLPPPLLLPCFGSLHHWGERRSSAESQYFHTHKDGVSIEARRRLRWRRRHTQSSDPQKTKCALVTQAPVGTKTDVQGEDHYFSKSIDYAIVVIFRGDTDNAYIMDRLFLFWFICMCRLLCVFYHVHWGGAGREMTESPGWQKHLSAFRFSLRVLRPHHLTRIKNIEKWSAGFSWVLNIF